jgi:carbamoyltransferase
MTILGISAFYHDSAAAIVQNGSLVAAAQEERFTRKKHDADFPIHAIKYCLRQAGVSISQVDAIVFYDKPLLKFERLLETYYGFAPKGLLSFLKAMPVWLKEKMFLKRLMREHLEELEGYDSKKVKFLFPEHHLSHAASAFYPSPFREAAVLTLDGVGEWATASISYGNGETLEIKNELHFPHSLGLLYSAFTFFLGFKVNSGEYKLMGLAPYGNADAQETKDFVQKIKASLVDIKPDGSIWLDQSYFDYATGDRMVKEDKWKDLFGFERRNEESELAQKHCNLAYAIQQVTEEIVLLLAKEAKRITGSENLCMAGGVALNCVANGKLQQANLFKNIFIQPASGDAGGAVGAAFATYHIYFKQERDADNLNDKMNGAYLGVQYSDLDIALDLKKYNAVTYTFTNKQERDKKTADLIAKGNVVGWFQGRMEFGPRSLGNRSILGDPRNPEMQKKLNLKIKFREGFRPFAPAVRLEDKDEYFEMSSSSPYMLLVAPVKAVIRKLVPENYGSLPMMERLYVERSSLPTITHVDFSARVQTIDVKTNPDFWNLLTEFKSQTSCGVLVNTSFNLRGEPPVCTPEDAYKCFMRTEMDYLVIGNYLLSKTEQPTWLENEDWKKEFTLD